MTSNLCTNTRRMWVVLCTRQSSALGTRFPHFVFPRLSLASPAFEPPSPFCFTAVLNFCGSGAKRCKIRVLPHSARQTLRAFHFPFFWIHIMESHAAWPRCIVFSSDSRWHYSGLRPFFEFLIFRIRIISIFLSVSFSFTFVLTVMLVMFSIVSAALFWYFQYFHV